ncbi:N-acetylmuramoyl-L-alanine amidase [Herbaspirillum sp. Sphag1AN]|uniref:N-acetylmuramoyl-L-alanine amidase n=1 Tax=unclassified Herbaspirillum TaxID=2624150 RepID=UPI001793AE69|nr:MULTISPECIES: N-acetylmuramoyl-L-alanine amidase [unclassified Herbaspirillum]MBB3213235.1 N-acetylmuramoyl-L-alanine amidase [Herbaspirillum sp. Sphag1AN]MBB3246432.1 N-acetylmuramoyl-L-alanine amidase [Herbaspirillum sp. Sphag64]
MADRGFYQVDTSHYSVAQNERVRFLVLHYTALDDAESLDVLAHGAAASVHYLVNTTPPIEGSKPVVLGLVPEDKRAWHAGVSDWSGRTNINDTSIGIEIVNPGYTDAADGSRRFYPFPDAQIDLVTRLAKDIVARYQIEPFNVLAHSDISPLRKSDPGPLFPWHDLYKEGIGAWPDEATVTKYLDGRAPTALASVRVIQTALNTYGYQIPQTGILDKETKAVISKFQMHFRAADIRGEPDVETEAIARALVEKYRTPSS